MELKAFTELLNKDSISELLNKTQNLFRTVEQNSIAELLNIVKQFQNCVVQNSKNQSPYRIVDETACENVI